jgi:glucose-1-phosphate adenylyltransferase
VDIPLSNSINAGFKQIYILTQFNSASLHMHMAKLYSFDAFTKGFVEILAAEQTFESQSWYEGTADAVRKNFIHFRQQNPDYYIILSGDQLYRMDLLDFMKNHIESGAEISIAATPVDRSAASGFGILQADKTGHIGAFVEKPPPGEHIEHLRIPPDLHPDKQQLRAGKEYMASMGIYIFTAQVLIDLLKSDDRPDFGKDILPSILKTHKVMAYPYRRENRIEEVVFFTDEGGSRAERPVEVAPDSGYWRDVGNLDAYWNSNMDLCGLTPYFNLYGVRWPMRTTQRQFPPVKTLSVTEPDGSLLHGLTRDSLVAHGCVIGGGSVRNSVLSYNVSVHRGAEVDESVIMENVDIGRFCKIKKAIIADNVKIPAKTTIGFNPKEDRRRFSVTPRGIVVVTSEDFS